MHNVFKGTRHLPVMLSPNDPTATSTVAKLWRPVVNLLLGMAGHSVLEDPGFTLRLIPGLWQLASSLNAAEHDPSCLCWRVMVRHACCSSSLLLVISVAKRGTSCLPENESGFQNPRLDSKRLCKGLPQPATPKPLTHQSRDSNSIRGLRLLWLA